MSSGNYAKYVVPQIKCFQLSLDGIEIPFKSEVKCLEITLVEI